MVEVRNKNPDISQEERTELSVAAAAAATSITVDNTEGFTANDFVVVGELGTETAEIVRVTAVSSATALAVTALVSAHAIDEPVQFTPYNQALFYNGTTETGSFTLISTQTIDFSNPNQFTSYRHEAGTTSDWYKVSWKNSQISTETSLSSAKQAEQLYCTVQDVSDWLNIDLRGSTKDVLPSQVIKIIRSVTSEIDLVTKTSFRTNTVSTSNYEYHDGVREGETQNYYALHKPIIEVTSFSTSTNDQSVGITSSTYNALTADTDYVLDKTTGRFRVVNDKKDAAFGAARVRIAYTWGRSAVPADIRRLATLMTVKDLCLTSLGRNIIEGREKDINMVSIDAEIKSIIRHYSPKAGMV